MSTPAQLIEVAHGFRADVRVEKAEHLRAELEALEELQTFSNWLLQRRLAREDEVRS